MRSALVLGAVLALASAGAVEGTWAGLLAPAAPLSDATGVGLAGLLAGTLGEAPEPPATPDSSSYVCSGTAPLTLTCGTEFQAPPGAAYRLYVNGGTGFTGTVTATLADSSGNWVQWSCSYTAFVGGVSPLPSCASAGAGVLHAGNLHLSGGVPAPDPATGAASLGFWEIGVELT